MTTMNGLVRGLRLCWRCDAHVTLWACGSPFWHSRERDPDKQDIVGKRVASKFGKGKGGSRRLLSVIVVVNGPRNLEFGGLMGQVVVEWADVNRALVEWVNW